MHDEPQTAQHGMQTPSHYHMGRWASASNTRVLVDIKVRHSKLRG